MVRSALCLVMIVLAAGCAHSAPDAPASLGGTSWRLVKFQGGDGTVLVLQDKTKFTVAFATDGTLNVRFDCNRGRGTWTSPGPQQLQFGPLALTRAACPGPLYDRIVSQWTFVRSYVIERGNLFLSLMADGGIYQFEPSEP
jgi:para-nitrobenzyl esterase